ncbi:MAG: hypothetical protein IT427_16960 [Pirellulales bacterium]|nr:hypothetical protein [Pirellulales bacterium]
MYLHRIVAHWRIVRSFIVLLVCRLVLPSTAQAAYQTQGPAVHGDTIPYLLVILCLALAFILLCRSSSRSKEVRLDDYDED